MLLFGSVILFFRRRNASSFLQLVGAGCFVVVVLAHIFEALQLFPSMQWGLEDSVGHYLDLWSAVLGITLFPVGICFIPLQSDATNIYRLMNRRSMNRWRGSLIGLSGTAIMRRSAIWQRLAGTSDQDAMYFPYW
jgi:hypothetical protein